MRSVCAGAGDCEAGLLISNTQHLSGALRVLKNPEFQNTLRVAGQEIAFQDAPEKFYDFLKVEAAKWTRVVQDSGARVE